MVFASQLFLFAFLPVVLLLYYALGKRLRTVVLVLASYAFYAWGAPSFLPILIAGTLVDCLIAPVIARTQHPGTKKALLAGAVAVNLGLLGYFKYAQFLVSSCWWVLRWTGISWTSAPVLGIALPIGISFFTFHKLSYLVDVYRGTVQPARGFGRFALYVALFPQLIAGPIVRYHEIADQLVARSHTLDKFAAGITRFAYGLAKKVLIANVLGKAADALFAHPASALGTSWCWVAAVCYTFQIYFDFSGYSDMAIGLGRMFGFILPENFNQPYASRSITEFWRRWHMSLSRWFKDYLYISLGGNRISPARTYVNLWVVFFLCGLWHGASWTFVIWGCYHGLLLVAERSFLLGRLQRLPGIITVPLTFLLVLVGWVFFRSATVGQAFSMLQTMVAWQPSALPVTAMPLVDNQALLVLLVAVGLSFHATWWPGLAGTVKGLRLPALARDLAQAGFAAGCLLLSWLSLAAGSYNPFIYYRF